MQMVVLGRTEFNGATGKATGHDCIIKFKVWQDVKWFSEMYSGNVTGSKI